ncbi:MAG: hypothetical protein Greene041619_644 [Candidatus Peregrinibacteria bacterium Greene0416_19]|nr:MAG: hypothetical protein Greene041619_644 [Candidatus Peregrinibacteria bacterium Greene0416_19]
MLESSSPLSFTGKYLAVAGHPRERQDGSVKVTLLGKQTDHHFLALCKNETGKVQIALRRMLLANGVTMEIQAVDVHNQTLEMTVLLKQVANGSREKMLTLLAEGMYVAQPHHFNGRKPINADQVKFAVKQGFLEMDERHIDALPDDRHAQAFIAYGKPGRLVYYPEANEKQREDLLRNRLRMQPGNIDKYSSPVWLSEEKVSHQPGEFIALRVNGIRSRFHAFVLHPDQPEQRSIVDGPDGSFIAFNHNPAPHLVDTEDARMVPFQAYDKRRRHLIKPENRRLTASEILIRNPTVTHRLLDKLEVLSGKGLNSRTSGIVLNNIGIRKILQKKNDPRVKSIDDPSQREQLERRARKLQSSLAPEENKLFWDSVDSSELRLIRQMQEEGMDAGASIVSVTFPEHAAMRAVMESDVHSGRRAVTSLFFRHPSANHGPFFSGDDFMELKNCKDKGMQVFWLHPKLNETGRDNANGTLLELVRLEKEQDGKHKSLAFVPLSRKQEFLNGFHMSFYGTARTLKPQYIAFMEELFEMLPAIASKERPFVIHSGGGPNRSTMGIANRKARENGFLSVGHVLGISKEPMNEHLDALMPFRDHDRDLRQGNMAKANDLSAALEGGGGTREERGISQTDLAIARERPFPLLLIGDDFYHYEYLQYLHEVSQGTLDKSVMDCVSLINVHRPEDAVAVIQSYIETGKVLSVIPEEFRDKRVQAYNEFDTIIPFRKQAWHEDEQRKPPQAS